MNNLPYEIPDLTETSFKYALGKLLGEEGINHYVFIDQIPTNEEEYKKYVRWQDPNVTDELPPWDILELEFEYRKVNEIKEYIMTRSREERRMEYPKIGEQLDMLFHELTTTGTISTTGEWYTKLLEIKNKYPKQITE